MACQALVEKSVMVLTWPQVRLPNADARLAAARQAPPPVGPRRGLHRPSVSSMMSLESDEEGPDAKAATAGDEA